MDDLLIFSELKEEKLPETLAMIKEVFMEYEAPDYSAEGIQSFLVFMEITEIKRMIRENDLKFWICENKGKIVGALAATGNHINLLFVRGEYHRQGIARCLFARMLEYYKPTYVTVNSSPYAS